MAFFGRAASAIRGAAGRARGFGGRAGSFLLEQAYNPMVQRAAVGAAAGGLGGYLTDNSIAGGAIGGALAAGPGLYFGRRFFRNPARFMSMGATGWAGVGGAIYGSAARLSGRAAMATKWTGRQLERLGLASSTMIGRNAAAVNKWGGRALAGLAVASTAHVGGSLLSSNR